MSNKPIGTLVDEYLKDNQQVHVKQLVSEATKVLNDMIDHAKNNYGATVVSKADDKGHVHTEVTFNG